MNINVNDHKIVLWGHKLHTHTHSYIHHAFYKAFKYLQYPTYWFDDQDDVSDFNFERTLFITEGQVDKNIPIRDDCFYVLHNCYGEQYKQLFKNNKCINLQVYTDAVLQYNLHKLEECIYADYSGKCLYFPWATDLLPFEIDQYKPNKPFNVESSIVHWIGTIGGGQFGNIDQITPFKQACWDQRIEFKHTMLISAEENIKFIKESYLAPTIVGTWQHQVGYVPCRIFKNISYGQMGLTNSPRVHQLFQQKIIHNNDTQALFYAAKKYMSDMTLSELHQLMDFVKNHHTYLNRIKTLLDFISQINEDQ